MRRSGPFAEASRGCGGTPHPRPISIPERSLDHGFATVPRPTVVLVHGAFADASSWSGVITRLQAAGVAVIAPANPLRGIVADSAYLRSVIDQIRVPCWPWGTRTRAR